jgi:hypothetical protein
MHPDLYSELNRAARILGTPVSTFAEKTLISRINHMAGAVLLDAIGRYTQGTPPKSVALHDLILFQGRPQEPEANYPQEAEIKRGRSRK